MNDIIPMQKLGGLMDASLENDDPFIIISEVQKLISLRDLVGKALANALGLLYSSWNNFSLSAQESFRDVMNSSLDIHPHTIDRYLKWYQYQHLIPEELQNKPIGKQLPMTNALSQGNHISEDAWGKLNDAHSRSEIRRIIREDVKHEEPRKSAIQIYISQSTGSMYCWKDDIRYEIGYVDINSGVEAVQQALTRIINNSGIGIK